MRVLVLSLVLLGACGGRRGNLFVRDGVTHVERYRQSNDEDERMKAVVLFKKALAGNPAAGAHTGIAALSRDPKRALKHLDDELEAHPELVAARFSRARLLIATGTEANAKKALEDLAKLQDDSEVLALRALARFLAGESKDVPTGLEGSAAHAEALAAYERVKTNPSEAANIPEAVLANAPRLKAIALAHAGKWEEALAALPADAAVDRAIAFAWLDRLDEARAAVSEALRKDPNDARAQALKSVLE